MPGEISAINLPLPFHIGQVNCYLIRSGSGFVLIDSGSSNARRQLIRELGQAGCKPGNLNLIVLTHGDFDHTGNAAYLRSAFGARIGMHHHDRAMAERGDMFANRKRPGLLVRILLPPLAGFGTSERFTPDILLEDEDNLSEFGMEARIISLPGHSLGSIGILTADGNFFCGDLLENIRQPGIGAIIDDAAAAKDSLAKIQGLDFKMIYPGHGLPFERGLLI